MSFRAMWIATSTIVVTALMLSACPPPGLPPNAPPPPPGPPPPPPPPPPGACGDGVVDVEVEAPEQCDDGDLNGDQPGACRADCSYPYCGDGIIDVVSANNPVADVCDDGNTQPGDGCSPACQDEIVAPPYGDVNGAVRNREYRAPNFLDGATVRIINAQCPPDGVGDCVSQPSALNTGAFTIQDVPTNAAIVLQTTYPETFDNGNGPQPVPAGFATRFKAYTNNEPLQTIDTFAIRYNSAAQLAVDCGVYADLNTALGNADFVVFSAFFGQVKDAAGNGVAGIDKANLYARLGNEVNDAVTRNNPTYFCWLSDDPNTVGKLIGTDETLSTTGYFMIFKARNDVNGTGVGNAYVGLTPNPVLNVVEASVPVNAGQIGVVTLTEDPVIVDEPQSFTNNVYPLFYQQLGCANCHYNGGIGYAGPNQMDFSGNAQQVYEKLTGNGTVCTQSPGEYPVCLNEPLNSLVLVKPLLGFAEENGLNPVDWHPNASYQDLNDANFVTVKQWIEQGAYNDYNIEPVVEPYLDVVIQEVTARGCTACHDYNDAEGGMPLNGCLPNFDYAAVGVEIDPAINANYKQDCVYYHLKNQDVGDDPYGYGKRVDPNNPEQSMLLYNAYCGPLGAQLCDPIETHPVRVWPDRDLDPTYQAILAWIVDGANNNYAPEP